MTTTPQTSAETDVVSPDTQSTPEPVSQTTVLITEQEVMFATAAALQPVKTTLDEPVATTPVVITEQEVVFATATAVPLQPVKTRDWISRVLGSIVVAASVTSNNEGRPKPRHYPPRCNFLEDSRMSRLMDRL